jgi:hypothetical protein
MADTATASATIKTWFETGDVPTQQQFADFITSYRNLVDNNLLDGKDITGVGVYPSSQGTAYAITKWFNYLDTSGSGVSGAILPATAIGKEAFVINVGGFSLDIYPPSGSSINSLAANAPFKVGVGEWALFVALSGNTWMVVSSKAINPSSNTMYVSENVANKSTTTTLGTSNTLYPTQNAVKTYVDNAAGVQKKIYRAYVTQSGTGAPSAGVFENSLGVTPTWGRISAGHFSLTATGLFQSNKYFAVTTPAGTTEAAVTVMFYANLGDEPDIIYFAHLNDSLVFADGCKFFIEIAVYP